MVGEKATVEERERAAKRKNVAAIVHFELSMVLMLSGMTNAVGGFCVQHVSIQDVGKGLVY